MVIPTYNRSAVSEAVKSALNQTHEKIEVIVVDDHSETPAKKHLEDIEDERMTVLRHDENKNGSAARNTGIDAASGDYIALLDDDDQWKPEKLEKQLKNLDEKEEEYRACYTGAETVYSDHSEEVVPEAEGDITKQVLEMSVNGSFGSTLIADKELVDKIDGFDEEFGMHQDWEFILRLLEKTKFKLVKEPLIKREVMYGYEPRDLEFLVQNKKRFIDKFSDKIQETGKLKSRRIKAKHYIKIAQNAAFKGKISFASKYFLKSLLQYPFLKPREIARTPYYYLRFLSTSP